jgi:hypothetical protein
MPDDSLTPEQQRIVDHRPGAFIVACPGAGKTRTIVARISRIMAALPPRKGLAVLSFTNSAVEEFIKRCHAAGIDNALTHPSFVGTFDAFLRQFFVSPGGIAGVEERPILVDSWDTIGVEVRLRGRNSFHGPGVGLDKFDAATNRISLDAIGHTGLRAHVLANQPAYERAAEQLRRGLRSKGYLSAADARVEVLKKLEDRVWSDALGRALAARFQEVIVDEAQDCNPLDLKVISWLRAHGVSVAVVADPDQAIYGFRHGNPTRIREFGTSFDAASQFGLTGNFRSAPAICALAATLRERAIPDDSVGDTSTIDGPVHVLTYTSANVPDGISGWFLTVLREATVDPSGSIVLAHGRKTARRACGLGPVSDVGGTSGVAKMARAVGAFWASTASSRAREGSLRNVERMILDMMGKIEDGETSARAAERSEIEQRWLRRTALELITRLPRSCDDTEVGRAQWVEALQGEVRRLGLVFRDRISERRYFRNPPNAEWNRHLIVGDTQEMKCATIHEAKGHEYDAVSVIIPPDQGGKSHATQLFDAWERRSNDESKRVIYVGVTRAKKLCALAVPMGFRDRLIAILEGARVAFILHDYAAAVGAAAPHAID